MKETVLVYQDSTHNTEERRESFSRVAWQNDWEPWDVQKKSDNTPYAMMYITRDEKTGISYMENHVLDVPYVIIRGENQGKIAEALSEKLDFCSAMGIKNFICSNPEDHRELERAIYLFAVAVERENFNTDYLATFEYGLTHPLPDVRRAAILAVGSVGWREFQPHLENIRASDPNPELREYATSTLEAMQKYHWIPEAG
jgi:hypothetical protein